jgi:Bacterial PH domain
MIRADSSGKLAVRDLQGRAKQNMTYVDKNLVPGETLLYETRHHWIVLLVPVLVGLLLGVPGLYLLMRAFMLRNGAGVALGSSTISPQGMAIVGAILLLAGIVIFAYGIVRRNATEMAVTNRRVLIKTGLASRRTLDLMLGRVESIGVEETVFGRMVGYGTVIVRGTGGTPETFEKIAHPQDFRRNVQEQIAPR